MMQDKRLDAIIIPSFDHSSPNLFYFTEYEDNGPNFLIVTKDYEVLITMDSLRAKKKSDVKSCISIYECRISDFLKRKGLDKGKIGIDGSIRYSFINELKKKMPEIMLEDLREDLLRIRAIKDDREIENIRNACLASDRILRELQQDGLVKNDLYLKRDINKRIVNLGKEWSFDTLVAGDENSSYVHYFPGNSHFKKMVLIDFGIKENQYTSDVTRTFIFENDGKIRKAFETLVDLHHRLEDLLQPEARAADIALFARKTLEAAGYTNTNFSNIHTLGHGVGLHEHEFPLLAERSTDIIEKNMTFTLEPAIYFPGEFGIRLEDTVVMKGTGIRRLSRFPFE